MNRITLVRPARAHSAYRIAAEEFATLAAAVGDMEVSVRTDAGYGKEIQENTRQLVLLGNDAVNALTASLYLDGRMENMEIRYGCDDYVIRTFRQGTCDVLLLAGGRPRAALYAVYRYFEVCCGCRWFWDGDRMGRTVLPFTGISLAEAPRFEYRGLRYFAHRSLHRFQAEHWSLSDWKREIRWMLKKRLNLFMLRIGFDDLYQKAFPEIVPYPDRDGNLPEAGEGFDDRNLFWSLEYRGELRRQVLSYAFDCDLMHPEDCGTMTHWYTRTPLSFLEAVKPKLLTGQVTKGYAEKTGLVWDIRDEENLDHYFQLTRTHIREYGRPELFHTIGLAERNFSEDREENLRLKMYTYHRIIERIREEYPNAPLLLASWDLWMYYTPDEVRRLLGQMDPGRTILLDYTSDTLRENNFTNWDVTGKFPWIFGIFEGYEPNNEIRGDYGLIDRRFEEALADEKCMGMILWPELSHGDTFMGEYLSRHGWEREMTSVDVLLEKFCEDRYPAAYVDSMKKIRRLLIPVAALSTWSSEPSPTLGITGVTEIFENIERMALFPEEFPEDCEGKLERGAELTEDAAEILRMLAGLSENMEEDEMLRRDIYDLARTVLARYIDLGILLSEKWYAREAARRKSRIQDASEGHMPGEGMPEKNGSGGKERMEEAMGAATALLAVLTGLLSCHEDYSLYGSLNRLREVAETNPHFEKTLKQNAANSYCRSFICENGEYLYRPEMEALFGAVRRALDAEESIDREELHGAMAEIRDRYDRTPLEEMNRFSGANPGELLMKGADVIRKMTFRII